MNIIHSAWIFLISLLVSCDISWAEEQKHVRIDAALTIIHPAVKQLFLYSGDQHMVLDEDGTETTVTDNGREELGMDIIQAVYTVLNPDGLKVLYFGKDHGIKLWVGTQENRTLDYGSKREFLKNGGPDAASKKGKIVYFFKGCEVAARYDNPFRWGEPEDLQSLGLPCDVDAAWSGYDGNSMVILKGNEIWLWKEDDTVEGPTLFHDSYDITSWVLDPVE